MTPREAAYLALLASVKNGEFVTSTLNQWQRLEKPSPRDFALAYEVASGSARMALALDYLAKELSIKKQLSLKVKERVLLRTALYQYYYLEKIPLYALVNDTIELAKKYCHKTFVSFLNALLRRLEHHTPQLPTGISTSNLSIHYSYPEYFIEMLIVDYGLTQTIEILKAGNQPPVAMAKVRPKIIDVLKESFISELPVIRIGDTTTIKDVALSPDYYIQNITPIALVNELASKSPSPQCILDLCSSPGGKLIAAHDLFPNASLYANDVSMDKIERLSENLNKYEIQAHITCGNGESYPTTQQFDLIILDVPCSNSGVLNKRHEARWRINQENLTELNIIQKKLIQHAATLLKPNGILWYLTCSVLKEENEHFLSKLCSEMNLTLSYFKTFLPNAEGWDGGFGAILRNSDAPPSSSSQEAQNL